jgi:hypothetical protein
MALAQSKVLLTRPLAATAKNPLKWTDSEP